MLVLFDIDGTLVSVRGAGRRALTAAIEAVTGTPDALSGIRLHGSTDPQILAEAFEQHVGRPLDGPEEREAILTHYLAGLREALAAPGAEYHVLPGVRALVDALDATGRHVLGLATGNIESAARVKLEPGDLSRPFTFGGYGSDARDRGELVAAAIARGQAAAQDKLGCTFAKDEIFVLGDTERDVAAARANGVVAVGILAGAGHPELLEDSRPDVLVSSMEDRALWEALGLCEGSSPS